MKILIADDYNGLSKQAADDLVELIKFTPFPIVCTASGDTPAGLYKEILNKVNKNQLDTSSWFFLSLDEWVGMNGSDEGSCRFHLNNQLLLPLQVPDDKIIFFDGRAKDLNEECKRMESIIHQHEKIDVAILGLGMNGHIGMNEPGTSATTRSHVNTLDPITQKVGQKYFKSAQQLTEGITLGLATLMESRHIFLLVSGSHKAGIIQQVLEGEISEKVPGSLLRNHPGLRIYLDKEAAKLVQSK